LQTKMDNLPFEMICLIASNVSGDDLRRLRCCGRRFSRIKPTLNSLPPNIRSKIFSFLSISDRKTLRLCSKSLEEEVSRTDISTPKISARIVFDDTHGLTAMHLRLYANECEA
ncbi:hypothetical protein PFISCL1PPCAC_22393, partial [Pristionchus fissidentatus]